MRNSCSDFFLLLSEHVAFNRVSMCELSVCRVVGNVSRNLHSDDHRPTDGFHFRFVSRKIQSQAASAPSRLTIRLD